MPDPSYNPVPHFEDASSEHATVINAQSDSRSNAPKQPPLPPHWRVSFNKAPRPIIPILHFAFVALCLVSLGHADLEPVWEVTKSSAEEWDASKKTLYKRLSGVTIVDGLLLTSTATFATVSPPVPDVLNYTTRGPYFCILLSFALTLGSLIVGSAIAFGMAKAKADWFTETLMGSRSRILCTMILLAYPFVATGLATVVEAFGLLAAAWLTGNALLIVGGTIVISLPVSMIVIFWWTQHGYWRQCHQANP